MTATKRFMNWTAVSFTPSGGSAINLTGVTNVSISAGGSLAKFSGDGDRYNTTVVNDFADPSVSVTFADNALTASLTPGVRGAFTATANDAKNLAVTGSYARVYALSGAIIESPETSGAHRQFMSNTVTLYAESSDGTTNPLSSSAA